MTSQIYTTEQITAAIEAEALDWAAFFSVSPDDTDAMSRRKLVMKANVAVGFFDPLLKYLEPKPVTQKIIVLSVKEYGQPGHASWRVTYNGNIIGDDRGYSSKGQALIEAARRVAKANAGGVGDWEGNVWVTQEYKLADC